VFVTTKQCVLAEVLSLGCWLMLSLIVLYALPAYDVQAYCYAVMQWGVMKKGMFWMTVRQPTLQGMCRDPMLRSAVNVAHKAGWQQWVLLPEAKVEISMAIDCHVTVYKQ